MTQAWDWGMGRGKAVGPKPWSPGPPAMGLGVVTARCVLGVAVGSCGVGEALPSLGCGGVPTPPSLAVPLGVCDSASLCPNCLPLPGVGSSPTALIAMAQQGHSSLCGLNLGRGHREIPGLGTTQGTGWWRAAGSGVRDWEATDPQG